MNADAGGLVAVILNGGSGDGDAERARDLLQGTFAERGRPLSVTVLGKEDSLDDAMQAAVDAGATMLVAGGGDGTVNGVTQHVVRHGLQLGVLPLGTLNHFAKDTGIPLELEQAVAVLLDGAEQAIDVAEVNGHYFVNNSSLGLYPRLVELRQQSEAKGIRKWIVAAWATARVLRECPQFAVRVDVGGHQVVRRTPLVFIGNNPYQMRGLDAGARASLTGGTLAIYIVRERRGIRMLGLMLRIMRGTARHSGQLEELRTTAATVETTGEELPVAVDGEVESQRTPLEYRVHPKGLRVMLPVVDGTA